MVEYAMTLPLFLLLVLGIIEFGLIFFQYGTITNAAREAARAGILPVTTACNQACLDGRAEAAAEAFADAAGLNPANLTVISSHPTASHLRVRVTYDAPLITGPMVRAVGGTGVITLATSATMQRE